MSMKELKACIFDLDGVIVDTARYHYLAWKYIADKLGFVFTEKDNERLKGVSRMRSLDILLEIGGLILNDEKKENLARTKNELYLEFIGKMNAGNLLPGASGFIKELRAAGILTGLGTASKNAGTILDRLNIRDLFDAIVDGNRVTRAKPDPEVFLRAAHELDVQPASCVVFEDAEAGIEAANAGGMFSVGVGDPDILQKARFVIPGLHRIQLADLRKQFETAPQ
jgi:beta-phosphoglucomutase